MEKRDLKQTNEGFFNSKGKQVYPCINSQCDKVYENKYSMWRHQAIHNPRKKYVCNFCDKRFALQQYLKDHMNIHTGGTPYQCKYYGCNQYFRQARKLELHHSMHEEKIFEIQRVPKKGSQTWRNRQACCTSNQLSGIRPIIEPPVDNQLQKQKDIVTESEISSHVDSESTPDLPAILEVCKQLQYYDDGGQQYTKSQHLVNLFKQPQKMEAINIYELEMQKFIEKIAIPGIVTTRKLPAPEGLRQQIINSIQSQINAKPKVQKVLSSKKESSKSIDDPFVKNTENFKRSLHQKVPVLQSSTLEGLSWRKYISKIQIEDPELYQNTG